MKAVCLKAFSWTRDVNSFQRDWVTGGEKLSNASIIWRTNILCFSQLPVSMNRSYSLLIRSYVIVLMCSCVNSFFFCTFLVLWPISNPTGTADFSTRNRCEDQEKWFESGHRALCLESLFWYLSANQRQSHSNRSVFSGKACVLS